MSIKTIEQKVCDINGSRIPAGFELTIKIEGHGSASEFSHVFEHVSPKAARQLRTKINNMIKAAADELAPVGNSAPVETSNAQGQDTAPQA